MSVPFFLRTIHTFHVSATCHTYCTDLPLQSYGHTTCHPCSGDMCHNLIGPTILFHINIHCTLPCQLYGHESCTICCHMSLYRLYNHHFLPVWKNEQIVISKAYDVRLNPLKLRWVRIDETYAHVCFESILSTLILGLPRPILVSRSNFVSHLPTKDLLVPQKVIDQSSSAG